MFALLGRLFGADKAAGNIIDHASNAIDKLVYTSQEKAEDQAKAAAEARGMVIEWLRSTQGQNLARRLIALVVTAVWVSQYLMAMTLSVVAVWVGSPDQYKASAKIIGDYAENMNGAMMLILGFYFAAPHLGTMVQGAIEKFSKRPPAGA